MSKAAIVKVNYTPGINNENIKGQTFHVAEEFEKFVALDVNGVTCDFSRSEVDIFDDLGLLNPKCSTLK